MKRTIILCLLLTACTLFNTDIIGSGNVIEKSFSLNEYNSISLEGGYYLTTSTNLSGNELKIKTDDNLFSYLEISCVDNKIKIKYKDGYNLRPTKVIEILISTNVSNIDLSGSLSIYDTNINKNSYKISSSGSISGYISGKCNNFYLDSSGSVYLNAQNLTNTEASLNVSGSIDTSIRVINRLNINISGSGYIKYFGNPVITKSISGSVTIEKGGN